MHVDRVESGDDYETVTMQPKTLKIHITRLLRNALMHLINSQLLTLNQVST